MAVSTHRFPAIFNNFHNAMIFVVSALLAISVHYFIWESAFNALLLVALLLLGSPLFRLLTVVLHLLCLTLQAYYFSFDSRLFSVLLLLAVATAVLIHYWNPRFPSLSTLKSSWFAGILISLALLLGVASIIIIRLDGASGVLWAAIIICFGMAVNTAGISLFKPSLHGIISFLLLILGVAGAIVVLEIGSRLFLEDLRQQRTGLCKPHPDILFILSPGFQKKMWIPLHDPTQAEQVLVTISEQGLRGAPISEKAPDELRIALVGDSFTFGWGVDDAYTLDRFLEALFAEKYPHKRVTVINGGVGNYGPWQSHIFFKERILPLHPDVVLFQALTSNDISDTLRKERRFLKTFLRPCALQTFQFLVYDQWQYKLERLFGQKCAIYAHFKKLTRRDMPLISLLARTIFRPAQQIVKVPEPLPRHIWHEPDLHEWYDTLEDGWHMFLEDLAAFRQTCLSHEIDVHFYSIPYPLTSCPHDHYPDDFEELYEMDKAENMLWTFFEENGWSYLKVREMLRNRNTKEEPIAFCGNGHLTVFGNKVLAQELFNFLESRYFLPSQANL